VKNEISGLLDKKMNRLEFLKHMGVGAMALTGMAFIVGALNSMGNMGGQSAGKVVTNSASYGGGAYGGDSKVN
jgi:hypothetical protein